MRVEKPSHILNNYLFNNTSYEKKEKSVKGSAEETEDMSFNDIFQIELAKLRNK